YGEHEAMINLLNSQGYYLLLNSDILGSIDSYESAYSYYLKYKISNYEIVEYTLKPLSNNYTRLGDYERALYLQQLSLNFLIRTNDLPEHIAGAYSNLAISYRSMSNIPEAENCVKKGLRLVASNSQTQLLLYNIMADILFDKKEYAASNHLLKTTIHKQQAPYAGNANWYMSAYTTMGNNYLKLNHLKEADESFKIALTFGKRYFKTARFREKANILTQRGKIKLLQKEPTAALQFFNETLQTLHINDAQNRMMLSRLYADNKLMDVFEQMGNAYLQLGKPEEALKSLKLVLFTADQIRDTYADDKTKERLQGDLKRIAEKAIETCYFQYTRAKNRALLKEILLLAEQSKSRTLLDQTKKNQQLMANNQKDPLLVKRKSLVQAIVYEEKQAIENSGATSGSKQLGKLKYTLSLVEKQLNLRYKKLDLSEVQSSHNNIISQLPKAQVIEYFMGADALYLILIQHQEIVQVVKISGAKQIDQMLRSFTNTYFQQGPTAMLNAPKSFFRSSYKIYQTVFAGLKLLPQSPLIIIPDGAIGYLSFDGLITSDQFHEHLPISAWPFLIKKQAITYAFSLATLTANRPNQNSKQFTGLFITHLKNKNVPLPAVEEEASAIQKNISGTFLFNGAVDIKSFNRAYETSKVLHIGTHAYLFGKSQEPTVDFDKEKLFLFELLAKKGTPSLVVLSACRTADGLLTNGEGIISLSRGFAAIGTPATIAGLWNVNDLAAAQLSANFYRHLTKKNKAGEALHQAKLDWLAQSKKANDFYNLPYYWDSLIYMGADQEIELAPARNGWPIYAIIVATLLVAVLLYLTFRNRMGYTRK
ncbi:MAG: CHAT domain-containing tetratricopeptide repeat protein, partial [Pedobacter sp.]|nr:CHAT domain-containing tetratricopeptide repeat protein [Pedobacter sp.]